MAGNEELTVAVLENPLFLLAQFRDCHEGGSSGNSTLFQFRRRGRVSAAFGAVIRFNPQ